MGRTGSKAVSAPEPRSGLPAHRGQQPPASCMTSSKRRPFFAHRPCACDSGGYSSPTCRSLRWLELCGDSIAFFLKYLGLYREDKTVRLGVSPPSSKNQSHCADTRDLEGLSLNVSAAGCIRLSSKGLNQ